MNEELLQAVIKLQKAHTKTIKELIEISSMLKNRIEVLEMEIKNK